MTTPWKFDLPTWQGRTVAVLGGAPGMSAAVAEAARAAADHVIAVNQTTAQFAPWADMLVALDTPWPEALTQFAGQRVAGVDDPDLDALYAGPWYERVELRPGHIIEFRNSGVAAIRIAAAMGARRILLVCFDPQLGRSLADGADSGARRYVGVHEAIAAITTQLAAQGVQVEHWAPESEPAAKAKRGARG